MFKAVSITVGLVVLAALACSAIVPEDSLAEDSVFLQQLAKRYKERSADWSLLAEIVDVLDYTRREIFESADDSKAQQFGAQEISRLRSIQQRLDKETLGLKEDIANIENVIITKINRKI